MVVMVLIDVCRERWACSGLYLPELFYSAHAIGFKGSNHCLSD